MPGDIITRALVFNDLFLSQIAGQMEFQNNIDISNVDFLSDEIDDITLFLI